VVLGKARGYGAQNDSCGSGNRQWGRKILLSRHATVAYFITHESARQPVNRAVATPAITWPPRCTP